MPSTRQYGRLTLRPINRKVMERLVIGIRQTERHNDMPHTQIEPASKTLLNPKLLKLYFATFFYFLLPFARFFVFFFKRNARAGMFKFDLATHRPAFSEVIVEIDYSVRNIKAPMTWIILIFPRVRIAIHIVAKKLTRISGFTITTYAEAITSHMFCNTI